MESIYTELALYESKNECARTDNVFPLISQVCDGTVSLWGQLKVYNHLLSASNTTSPQNLPFSQVHARIAPSKCAFVWE